MKFLVLVSICWFGTFAQGTEIVLNGNSSYSPEDYVSLLLMKIPAAQREPGTEEDSIRLSGELTINLLFILKNERAAVEEKILQALRGEILVAGAKLEAETAIVRIISTPPPRPVERMIQGTSELVLERIKDDPGPIEFRIFGPPRVGRRQFLNEHPIPMLNAEEIKKAMDEMINLVREGKVDAPVGHQALREALFEVNAGTPSGIMGKSDTLYASNSGSSTGTSEEDVCLRLLGHPEGK